jgi:hypothetical protein
MYKLYKYIVSFLRCFFPKKEYVCKPNKKYRQRVQTLWPSIVERVELWEECYRDTTCHKKICDWYSVTPEELRKVILEAIPIYGAYAYTNEAMISDEAVEQAKIPFDNLKGLSMSCVHFAEDMDGTNKPQGTPFRDYGILVFTAAPTDELPKGWFAMDEGMLYNVKVSHWARGQGHFLIDGVVVLTPDKRVCNLWRYTQTAHQIKCKNKRGYVSIPQAKWMPMSGDAELVKELAFFLSLSFERNAHWACTVRSAGVPPLAFPVLDHDIARVFPKRQRDGDGKIVHWTRTHSRKTKQGLTNVKAHIRGNTSWNIDGRTVTITMPGKHHNMVTEIKNVNCSRNKLTVIRDPITGINMYGAKDAVINKGLSNAVITKQEIEIEMES